MSRFSVFRIFATVIALLALLSLGLGCIGSTASKTATDNTSATTKTKEEPIELNVWAAAGIKNAMIEIAPLFEKENNIKLVFNFAASGDLQTQIEQGAPADVFISAGKKQIAALDDKQLLAKESIKNLVGNDLIIAAPKDSKLSMSTIEDLATLNGVRRIAMGNPDQVPAGKYGIQALQKAGIWSKVQPKIIYTKDIPQISSYLNSGEVDMGLIYNSELTAFKNIKTLLLIPEAYHDPIVFTGAVVKSAKQPDMGAKLIDFILEDEIQKMLKDNGFKPIANLAK